MCSFVPTVALADGASLLPVTHGVTRLTGQSCGFFDAPSMGTGTTGVAPDGSSAFLGLGTGEHRTTVCFEHHAFHATAATADDPCVLGRVTVVPGHGSRFPTGALARLNLSLFLALPRAAVVPLTRLVIPLGWAPVTPSLEQNRHPAATPTFTVLVGGCLLHVPLTPMTPAHLRPERVPHRGLLRLNLGLEQAGRPLCAVLALRVLMPHRALPLHQAA